MKYKIQYKDFLKTLNEKDIDGYYLVMKLHKQGHSKKDIKNKTKVSDDKLHQWRNQNIKPISIKILEEAKEREYFNEIRSKALEDISYLVGYNLGDGNISKNLCNTWFYGVNSDLIAIKDLLLQFNVKPVIYTYKINNGKMAVHDRVFSRFLFALGAVIGDKTKSKIEIPRWILKTKKASSFKKKFLQGFFDSELSNLNLIKSKNFCFQTLKFYTSKERNYIKEGTFLLQQIKNLLDEFNVKSSEIKLDRAYIRSRDNSNMQQIYFTINSNYINLYNFIKNVGFLYNSKRRNNCLLFSNQIKNKANEELDKIKKYELAKKLRNKGFSAYKIAKKLDINIYHIKNWIYFNRKPSLYNFINKTNNS